VAWDLLILVFEGKAFDRDFLNKLDFGVLWRSFWKEVNLCLPELRVVDIAALARFL